MNAILQSTESVADSDALPETGARRAGGIDGEHRWADAVLAGENKVLEMIAGGSSLSSILEALCRVVEEMYPGSFCSILLLDANGERLWQGAAPSLPKSYSEAMEGREVAKCWGPCGMAAFRK
jgi:hypothetical protein